MTTVRTRVTSVHKPMPDRLYQPELHDGGQRKLLKVIAPNMRENQVPISFMSKGVVW